MVNLLLSAFSGLLLSAAFEPISLWWIAPIALALEMFALSQSERKYLSVLAFALTFNLVLLHWTSTYVGSVPWVILAVGLTLFYLPLVAVKRLGIAFFPLIFIVMEEVRNRFPFQGFGWARIAYSQADAPYAKIAAYGGAVALSAITVLAGLVIFYLSQKQLRILVLFPIVIVAIPINVQMNQTTQAFLIQGNVPKLGLDFNSRAKEVFYNHVNETDIALKENKKVDFILWPENSVDVDPFRNPEVFEALNRYRVPLIVGAIVGRADDILNTSILWTKEVQNVYIKQHLTPFGEYIPLRSLASKISPFVDDVRDFSPGSESTVFTVAKAKIAPVICYELLDDDILEKAAKSSNLLVVQTNNATFGDSAQSAQQLQITRIRAIEHSRNILSVSTTGYSAVIDYKGKVLQKSDMASAQHLYAEVGVISSVSPRDRYGDWALVVTLIWLLMVTRGAYIYRR
ncbi:MAG: apolipoprotein N-acyltransferase [Actinobacteria bacterium]|nr:apolipoprotein N-acyltransferase [Actinomycetota bacterium]NCV41666.1 apolipoprotein N-acyltransferase [Actinomycetota bacterium]NCV81850.1 apolipoprotein N-acyltransferase [Actinomycetota bacterium]NCW72066.1 apolipoprotein N-acyltransferase [Actinomycetota bacterium]NCW92765.1 apolipoprotein N-acyltransferase [Actinomycetota bacterium]